MFKYLKEILGKLFFFQLHKYFMLSRFY